MAATNRPSVRALVILSWVWSLQAHDVISTKITWSQEISRIVYARCLGCHRDGGAAPMALLSYSQVRPWAKAIKEEINERRMPPWGAMKGFGEFKGDNSLSPVEIHLIADWVEGGVPEGDPQYLPPIPQTLPTKPTSPVAARLVRDGQRLGPMRIVSVAPPLELAEGASLQAVVELPDGATMPLLWLYNFRPKHARTFVYHEPIQVPAGSVLRISGDPGRIRIHTTTPAKP